MSIGVTPRANELLVFLSSYIAHRHEAPTIVQMTEALGLKSKSNAHELLLQLEERGRIARLPYRKRAIEILDGPRQVPTVDMRDTNRYQHYRWDDGDKRLVPLAPLRIVE